MATLTLNVRILSPQQTLFQGQALAVSSKNSKGNFDILPQHANFITLVKNSPILIRLPDKSTAKYQFDIAIIYTVKNQVNIYTQI